LIQRVAVTASPKKRSDEKQKVAGKVTLLHTASLGRLDKFSTLDILDNKVQLIRTPRIYNSAEERKVPTDEDKLKRVFDENAML